MAIASNGHWLIVGRQSAIKRTFIAKDSKIDDDAVPN